MAAPLRLRAQDAEDLAVIAGCLQDALIHVGEMTYQARRRRFVAAFNRYRWERDGRKGEPTRVRAGLHFDGVLAVKSQGIDRARPGDLLELLTIACEEGADASAVLTLVFARDASIRLDLECIDCTLADTGAPWQALARPDHRLDDTAEEAGEEPVGDAVGAEARER